MKSRQVNTIATGVNGAESVRGNQEIANQFAAHQVGQGDHRAEDARAAVRAALAAYPDLTIERIANDLRFSPAERRRFVETVRLAGFPPCAAPEAGAPQPPPSRLPECEPPPRTAAP